jgi:guanylate kinase
VKGKAIIFSAPSGAGKTTIVRHLLKIESKLQFSVSACTRPKRSHEVHGVDYYFLSPEEFKLRISQDQFVEWEEVYENNFYGTLKSEVERIWRSGQHVIFDFKEDALAVFVKPPSKELLEMRLRQRQTETEESIARRLGKADWEIAKAIEFDYILLNDEIQKALIEAEKIVRNFIEKE